MSRLTAPANVITIEITEAKIGRWMKNREITTVLRPVQAATPLPAREPVLAAAGRLVGARERAGEAARWAARQALARWALARQALARQALARQPLARQPPA
ncbi:MAG: hypothetical protein O2946_12235, partial [Planctomycetota bacterium]|nr:hypothetical protein [Planctomycetota bacterium]